MAGRRDGSWTKGFQQGLLAGNALQMQWQERFADLKAPARIWAVGAILGCGDKLRRLHDRLLENLKPADAIVYLGDFLGVGPDVQGTVTELLDFRRAVLSMPGALPRDVVFLRGRQEDFLFSVQQLQFAQYPERTLNAALEQGLAQTLESYHVDVAGGKRAARDGPVTLTRWTLALKTQLRSFPGHMELVGSIRRAAFTAPRNAEAGHGPLLFVNAGLDPAKPVIAQKNAFWTDGAGFDRLDAPYGGFARVIRGFDPKRAGFREWPYKVSLDGGDSGSGVLYCVGFRASGEIEQTLDER